ncbi:ankyrin [Aspergillus uvarum CBS 121591]|uniref:Ankyrin n=1 Tax=Aspergillus uvarum CBS 121591 TaxID=1448315 RepID=A0A319C4I9_9EURO|nr:ankyrin [Aspergillus uvarum CBS 121591]PYH79081.1 ankyrin [Aspergillus uvarum CBS 121591]
MYVSWSSSLPWLRFMSMLEYPKEHEASSSSSLLEDLPRDGNKMTKVSNFELLKRLSSVVPWTTLQHPSNIYSGSRTSAVLHILMPEIEHGQHDILATALSTSHSGLRDHLSVVLYLISNNLTSEDPEEFIEEKLERDDKLILKILKDTGWDDLKHLKILLSTHEPTAESITEQVFASALRTSNVKVLENMLRSGMSPNRLVQVVVEEEGACFLTPLQFAACEEAESVRLINLLINYGADVDFSIKEDGETALWHAICTKNEPAVRELLLRGATVTRNCASAAGYWKPEETQDFALFEDIINIYLDQHLDTEREDPEILEQAVMQQNVPVIEAFLARGARLNGLTGKIYLNGRDPLQSTLLGDAVRTQNIDIVQLLSHVSIGTDRPSRQAPYMSPLALAAAYGLTDITEFLLASGADIRAADNEKMTLLERAVEKDNPALCQILIRHGAKVDREPRELQRVPSALLIAVQQNLMDIVDLLINSNARLNDIFDVDPGTILAAAVEVGDEAMINKLVNAGARLMGLKMKKIGNLQTGTFLQNNGFLPSLLDSSGPELLAAAISAQDDALAWFLLQNNAHKERNRTSVLEETPLWAALKMDNLGFVLALLESGARVTDDALTETIIKDNFQLLPMLLAGFTGSAPTAVSAAVLKSSMIDLELLRKANVDMRGAPQMSHHKWGTMGMYNLQHCRLESVLEIAAWKAEYPMFKYILEWASSAQMKWTPKSVARALTLAIFKQKHDHIAELMRLDSDLNCDITRDYSLSFASRAVGCFDTYTPLQAAVKTQQASVVRDLLVLKGADINYSGEGQLRRTPLQHAVELGNMEIINLLLEHGADVNAPAAYDGGATALQIAAIQGYIGIARKLLDLGADINQGPACENGRTALMGAAEHGRIDMLHMLLDEGALVVGEYEEEYYEAVELAEGQGHYAAARLLKSFKGND